MNKHILFSSIVLFLSSSAFAATTPVALSLHDALAQAYLKNPDLEAARAELRGTDETFAQALAGFKPSVSAAADYTTSRQGSDDSDPKQVGVALTQSLFSGGGTVASVDAANNRIRAGRARLKITEQQVLLSAVTAYMNTLRDAENLELNKNNEKVMQSHLTASEERFKLGDITKTDVSQAKSRLALATANRIAADGALRQSAATFERVIGVAPTALEKPTEASGLPATEDAAVAAAHANSPAIAYAKYTQEATKATTRTLEAGRLPEIDLTGQLGRVYDPANSFNDDDENNRSLLLRATLPLYQGGGTVSRIRQSRHVENQLRLQSLSAERTARETAVQAWEELAAATAGSQSLQTQVEAEQLALEGVRVEAAYGSRTTLDLLDAEQEYLTARVSQVGAERDRIVAGYALLSAVGRLTAQDLKLGVPVYDPVENFQNLKKGTLGAAFYSDK